MSIKQDPVLHFHSVSFLQPCHCSVSSYWQADTFNTCWTLPFTLDEMSSFHICVHGLLMIGLTFQIPHFSAFDLPLKSCCLNLVFHWIYCDSYCGHLLLNFKNEKIMFSHNSTYFLCNKSYDNTYLPQFFNPHFSVDCSTMIEVGFFFV